MGTDIPAARPMKLRGVLEVIRMANTLALEAGIRENKTPQEEIGQLVLETQIDTLKLVLSLVDRPVDFYRRHGEH